MACRSYAWHAFFCVGGVCSAKCASRIGVQKPRTETKVEKFLTFLLFGFSCNFLCFLLFDFLGFLADSSTFLDFFGSLLFGFSGTFWAFDLCGLLALSGLFGVLRFSGTFGAFRFWVFFERIFCVFSCTCGISCVFLTFRVRLFVSVFSRVFF